MAVYDILILGSGPAGLAAAIYAKRAELSVLVIEKNFMSGGQILNTYEVDNYPGLPGISGFDMGTKFREHADKLGAEFVIDNITGADLAGEIKTIRGEQAVYEGKTVIIATGAHHRTLGIPGEGVLTGAGVSYCATCDGAFFRKKTTAVIGGGDVALEDAIYLARLCQKVYVIHRRDEFRGAKSLQRTLLSMENVEVLWDTIPEEICGDGHVEKLRLKNKKTGETNELPVDGVFVAVGIEPESAVFAGGPAMDDHGYILAGEDGKTSIPGVFAAGDIRTKPLRQVVTAVADGANCVTSAEKYLAEH